MLSMLSIDLLPSFFTAADLAALLAVCPGVIRGDLIRNQEGKSIGTAILHVRDQRSAERIVAAFDGAEVRGYPIRISRLEGGAS